MGSSRRRRTAGFVLGALLVALLAGCGGKSSGLSRSKYIEQADAVCAAAKADAAKVPKLGLRSTNADYVESLRQALAITEPAVAKLDALDGPDAEQKALEQNFIVPTRAQIAAGRVLLDDFHLAGGDPAKEKAAIEKFTQTVNDPQRPIRDAALRKAGFDACSKTNQD